MIFVLALTCFFGLLVALSFLLRDFSRFVWKKTKVASLPNQFVDFGPYVVTIFFTIAIAFLGLLFHKFNIAIFAYFLSDNLTSFFILLRGVFTLNSEVQNPLLLNHLISGMFITPALQFLSANLIYKAIRDFMFSINRHYVSVSYTESDVLYFGFLSAIIFILLEIVLYSQNIPTFSAIAHLTYLGVSNLSVVGFFLAIAHIQLLKNEHYKNSLSSYINMNKAAKAVVYSPWRTVLMTYGIALILHLPFYTGTQFLENNWILFIVYVLACIICYLTLKLFLSRGYNYLGVVMLAEGPEKLGVHGKLFKPKSERRFYYLLSIVAFFFALIKLKLFFFFILLLLGIALSFLIGLSFSYLFSLGLSLIRAYLLKFQTPKVRAKPITNYILTTSKAFIRGSNVMLGIIFFSFVFLSFFPKPFKYENNNFVHAVFDHKGQLLFAERGPDNPCIPVSYSELPKFLIRCLYLQEDRKFFEQDSWLPNRSNWHGISLSMFYRYFSGGGGSNLTQQLIKNVAFQNVFPQDIQRKFAETLTAYQLSIQGEKEAIITNYLNEVGFNGGSGHSGVIAGSLYTFGRSLKELNLLEMMYLVATLKRGTDFKSISEYIEYKNAAFHEKEIKEALLLQAESWYNQSQISIKELNIMKNENIRFVNQPYVTPCLSTTDEFFRKAIMEEGIEGVTYQSSIKSENQKQIVRAVKKFEVEFHGIQKRDPFKLYSSALVVDIKTGSIIGHYGGEGVTDLASFGNGYPVASIIKPFLLLELLEEGWAIEDIKLFDGKMRGRFTPNNSNGTYSNQYVGIDQIIGPSLNAPLRNLDELTDPLKLFNSMERKFSEMGIPNDPYLDLDDQNKKGEHEINYPLGSRNMTLFSIAQMYQTLLNKGTYRKLSTLYSGFDPISFDNIKLKQDQKHIYKQKNADAIKSALSHTMKPGGTGALIKNLLPQNKIFYAKSGTSDGGIHGYFSMSDGEILIVTWISYCREINGRLVCNDSPSIPHESGARTAGVLAASIYNHLK